jgi:hypothetical protein
MVNEWSVFSKNPDTNLPGHLILQNNVCIIAAMPVSGKGKTRF